MSKNSTYPLSLGLNHPSVQEVMRIAIDLAKEHKIINTELLYNKAKKELKIPKQGLKRIIQMLLTRKFLVDGSRFTKKTVLKNRTRNYIYWLVNTYTGSHFSFIKEKVSQIKESEVGVGHLIWHLEKLIKFNLIKKVKIMNYTIFLPTNISNEEGTLYFFLRDKLSRSIIKFLLNTESVYRADLYKELGVKREKVYYRIKKLTEFNIICPLPDDEKKVSINSDKKVLLEEVVDNILSTKRIKERERLLSTKI